MKYSILVPVYNVEQYLKQCVDSLLDQSYKGKYEIILVDDGSTDSSGIICDTYAEKHPEKIKVIHKKNGGHSSARREAMNNASGEYSLFCDSDDFVESNLLESVDNIIENNPETDMVMYSFQYYENGKKTPRKIAVWDKFEVFEGVAKKKLYELMITTPHLNSLCTKAIKTEIFKACRIDYSELKGKDIAEDAYIISHFVTDCKKIININKPLYNYRTNRKSISRAYPPEKIERKNMLFLYRRFIQLLPVWGMDNDETLNKIYSACFGNAMYLFRMHYEHAKGRKKRSVVLEYNWNSMLFDEIVANPEKYGNSSNIKLYKMLTGKKHFSLRLWFFKDKLRKTLKTLKKTLKGA